MTAGLGNLGVNDYPATIAISAAGPSVASGSAVNFPRPSVTPVGIIINNPGASQTNNTEFILPSVGAYRISWSISIDEAAQLSLWISTDGGGTIVVPPLGGGGLFSEYTVALGVPGQVGRATGTSQIMGDTMINNTVAGAAIQIRNYASASALTVTPLPGGISAQSSSLIIQRLL